MNFWDAIAPVYDIAEKTNGKAYGGMLNAVSELIPEKAEVLECAAGTGAISIAVANKSKQVLCTDMSSNMLEVAKRKADKAGINNIRFEQGSIYRLDYKDHMFDVVIASQILHLLDEPQKAAEELKRVAKTLVVVPVCLLDDIGFFAKIKVGVWKLLGFAPQKSFNEKSYREFLHNIGLTPNRFWVVAGQMPMAIAVHEIKSG